MQMNDGGIEVRPLGEGKHNIKGGYTKILLSSDAKINMFLLDFVTILRSIRKDKKTISDIKEYLKAIVNNIAFVGEEKMVIGGADKITLIDVKIGGKNIYTEYIKTENFEGIKDIEPQSNDFKQDITGI